MFQRLVVTILVVVVAAFAYQGCSGGSSGGGGGAPPLTLAVTSGDNQTVPEGSTVNIVVTVTDQSGSPAIGAVIDFNATFPNGGSQQASATVAGAGTLFVFTLNSGVGIYNISMTATLGAETSNTLQITETATAAPTSISLPPAQTSGNAQTGPGATLGGNDPTLPNALIVTVVDQNNTPLSGATVTFTLSQPLSGLGSMQGISNPLDPAKPTFTLTPITSQTLVTVTTDSSGQAGIYLIPGVSLFSGANTVAVTATFSALTAPGIQFTATGT